MKTICHGSNVMCHVLCVMCRVSCVTCHLSLTTTGTAIDPSPANFTSWLVCKDQKTEKNMQTQKHQSNKNQNGPRVIPILAIHSLTRSLQFISIGFSAIAQTHNIRNLQLRDLGQTMFLLGIIWEHGPGFPKPPSSFSFNANTPTQSPERNLTVS